MHLVNVLAHGWRTQALGGVPLGPLSGHPVVLGSVGHVLCGNTSHQRVGWKRREAAVRKQRPPGQHPGGVSAQRPTLEQHWVPTRRWAVCPQHSRAPQVTPQRWRSPGRTEVGQEVRNSCSYLRQARREKASFLLQSKSTGLSIIEIRKTHCRDLPGLT